MADFDLSNFLASFFDEARERLNSMNQGLVAFESGGLDAEGLIALRRDAHTIKGSALMLGVSDIGGVAHLFEDVMEQLIENPTWRRPEMTQFLYDLHDELDVRLQDPDNQKNIDLEPLRVKYDALLEAAKEGALLKDSNESIDENKVLPDDELDIIEIDLDADTPDLESWIQDDGLAVDLTFSPEMEADGAAIVGDDEESEKKYTQDFSGLIGADEADSWKAARAMQQAADKKQEKTKDEVFEQGLGATLANEKIENIEDREVERFVSELTEGVEDKEDNTVQGDALTPLPENAFSETDTYCPDIAKIEMKATAQRRSSGRFLRVDAERLENLSNQVIELSTEQSRGGSFEEAVLEMSSELRGLQREWRYFSKSLADFDEDKRERLIHSLERGFENQMRKQRRFIEELSVSKQRNTLIHRDLRDQVLSLMLRPLDSIFSTFPRAVRDVAVRLNKRARLVIGGKTLEVDQGVAESLVEPLVHLLNNAVAHGIESPEERLALGKPEEGQVAVIARLSGSEVRIEVVDDGQGLDVDRIKEVAVERGVTTQVEADNMDSAEILEMIFRPGFSTKKEVDATSGRGIGMNVVQDTIRRLTGSIRIHTEKGQGTRFVLSLPVSIAVQKALMFRMGNVRFGMLTHMVEQAIPLNKQILKTGVGDKQFIMYGKHQVPIVDMRRMLSGEGANAILSKTPNVLIAEHIEGYVGIVVDELMSDVEVVVRNLDPYIKRYQPQGLMGNTIADDGSVVMLLEPYGIKEMGRTAPDQTIEVDVSEEEKIHCKILLVEDSLIAREVEKSIFESIGFTVDTAIDGLDGLEKLETSSYDMVVTDLEMPRLDGFGFVRRIRNQPEYEDLPLMIISTRESAEDRMRAMESGADTYMVKQHLNGDDILKNVQALLGSVSTPD
ncbi:MAG: hybrid sensor histidine kinase/response regulator [Mariprofundaceae bacterium]|nr:hybrid sensor histidine kinase/response regulator [Mariprofundaceae bacterium]